MRVASSLQCLLMRLSELYGIDLLGVLMRRFDFPCVLVVIGMILSPLAEAKMCGAITHDDWLLDDFGDPAYIDFLMSMGDDAHVVQPRRLHQFTGVKGGRAAEWPVLGYILCCSLTAPFAGLLRLQIPGMGHSHHHHYA